MRRAAAAGAGRAWLLATSGGVDSMALAEVTRRWRRRLCDRLVVAHVHHGAGDVFRDRAREVVRAYARAHRLPFVTNAAAATAPADEAGLRRVRYAHLERWRRKYCLDTIVLAHHRDDLIETRVHRLLRGTGPRGLVAMPTLRHRRLRPLIGVPRAEIAAYARARGLTWVEDPTNHDAAANVRAWLRHAWLPALEARLPGAGRALARSLEVLGEVGPGVAADEGGCRAIRRAAFAGLPGPARARVVSDYVASLGGTGFARSHVLEITKRLDTRRKEFTFRVRDVDFHVGAHLWWASRVCD